MILLGRKVGPSHYRHTDAAEAADERQPHLVAESRLNVGGAYLYRALAGILLPIQTLPIARRGTSGSLYGLSGSPSTRAGYAVSPWRNGRRAGIVEPAYREKTSRVAGPLKRGGDARWLLEHPTSSDFPPTPRPLCSPAWPSVR